MSKEYRISDTIVWSFVAESDEDAEEAREYLDLYGTRPEGAVSVAREVEISTGWEDELGEQEA